MLELVADEVTTATLVRVTADISGPMSRQARIVKFARAFPGLALALRRTRPQLVHVNNGGYPGSELCRAATIVARFARAPRCVLSVNSAPLSRDVSYPKIEAIADRLVWGSVDAVHVGTAFVEKRLGELRGMPADLGAQIPYGVVEPSGTIDDVKALRERLTNGNALLVGMVSAAGEAEKGPCRAGGCAGTRRSGRPRSDRRGASGRIDAARRKGRPVRTRGNCSGMCHRTISVRTFGRSISWSCLRSRTKACRS